MQKMETKLKEKFQSI
jgi:hypothetical protein